MIESQYRDKVNSFLRKSGRLVFVFNDRITKDKLDTAVVFGERPNHTVWVEHKRIQRPENTPRFELRLKYRLKRDFQLHTALKLEEHTDCYYLIHLEIGNGRSSTFHHSVLILPSVVERSIIEDVAIPISGWDSTLKLDAGAAKIVDRYERLLEVM